METNPAPQGEKESVNSATDPVEDNSSEPQGEAKTYTASDLDAIMSLRMAKAKRKFDNDLQTALKAEKAQWEKTHKPATQNVEEEYRAKLSEYEELTKSQKDKISKYQNEHLNNQIEKALTEEGCIDPSLAANYLKSEGLVSLDDDGEIVVEKHKSLSDLAKSFLTKKPHLKKATTQGGLGTKQPSNVSALVGDPTRPGLLELETTLGIPKKQSALF